MINFEQYDRDNPNIWRQFMYFAKQAKYVKGFKTYSAKSIFELIRWHTPITGNDGFKLNNNYHADYARKLMQSDPQFKTFFRIRKMKAKRVPYPTNEIKPDIVD